MRYNSQYIDFSVIPHEFREKSLPKVPIFNKLQRIRVFYNRMLLRLLRHTTDALKVREVAIAIPL